MLAATSFYLDLYGEPEPGGNFIANAIAYIIVYVIFPIFKSGYIWIIALIFAIYWVYKICSQEDKYRQDIERKE